MRELKDIFPPSNEIKFGDNIYKVQSFKAESFPLVAELLTKVFSQVNVSANNTDTKKLALAVVSVYKENSDLVLKLISKSTGVDIEIIKETSAEGFLFLIEEVISVNKDFFSQRVLPKFNGMMEKVNQENQPQTSGKS